MFLQKQRLSKQLFDKIDEAIIGDLELMAIADKRIRMIRCGDTRDILCEFNNKIDSFCKQIEEIRELKDSGIKIKKRNHRYIIESRINTLHKNASDLCDTLKIERDKSTHDKILLIVDRVIHKHLKFIQLVNQVKGDDKT